MIAVLDCGTTNTKCYVVNEQGQLMAEGYSGFGVKDNSLKKDREDYKKSLRQVVKDTCRKIPEGWEKLEKVIGFGMISSELGLFVVPHLTVPVGLHELQRELYQVNDNDIFPKRVAFFLIRGVMNALPRKRSLENVKTCDFMRGEETQVMGILEKLRLSEAFNVLIFSSHFKAVHVSAEGRIEHSMTTMSGQIFECISRYTVVGSSVEVREEEEGRMTRQEIIELARKTLDDRGMMRALFLPRFMEIFTDMTAWERRFFLDAAISLEDMKAIREYYGKGQYQTKKYYLVGQTPRCNLFADILREEDNTVEIEILGGRENTRDVSIEGALKIAKICEWRVNEYEVQNERLYSADGHTF